MSRRPVTVDILRANEMRDFLQQHVLRGPEPQRNQRLNRGQHYPAILQRGLKLRIARQLAHWQAAA